MNKNFLLLIYILFKFTLYGQLFDSNPSNCGGELVVVSEDATCNTNPYILVFEDNFDGSELNLTKWKLPYQGVQSDFIFSQEKQWYANTGANPFIPFENNIQIENGILKLIAKKEIVTGSYTNWDLVPAASVTETFNYTSGKIESKYKFEHGIFEMRCKIPKGKGFFPAFWTYGGPEWNEIDVFEFANEKNIYGNYDPDKLSKVHNMNIHYDYDRNGTDEFCSTGYTGPDFSADFHTFKLVWTPHKMEWYMDGDLKRVSTLFYSLQGQIVGCSGIQAFSEYIIDKAFPRRPMNIIANLAIQYGINIPDEETPFPSALEIDYIRYYKQIECSNQVVLSDEDELSLDPEVFNIIMANKIVVNEDFDLGPGQQLALVAGDEIEMSPQFFPDFEADFSAVIDPSICPYSGMAILNDDTKNDLMEEKKSIKFHDKQLNKNHEQQITTELSKSKITISPNPTNDKLVHIKLNTLTDNEEFLIELKDLSGRVVYSNQTNKDVILDLLSLTSGIYFINLFDKNKIPVFADKIILNK